MAPTTLHCAGGFAPPAEVNGADDFVCSRLASTTVIPLPLGGCRPLGEFLRRRQLLQSTHKCRVRTRLPKLPRRLPCLPPPLVKVGLELWLPLPVLLRVGLRLPSAGMQRRSSLVVVHAPGLPSADVQSLCCHRGAYPPALSCHRPAWSAAARGGPATLSEPSTRGGMRAPVSLALSRGRPRSCCCVGMLIQPRRLLPRRRRLGFDTTNWQLAPSHPQTRPQNSRYPPRCPSVVLWTPYSGVEWGVCSSRPSGFGEPTIGEAARRASSLRTCG